MNSAQKINTLKQIMDFKDQIRKLRVIVVAAIPNTEEFGQIWEAGKVAETILTADVDLDQVCDIHRDALHLLSASIPEDQPGGWIAERGTVYRVKFTGHRSRFQFRNRDAISVQMADDDVNGSDGNASRAREIADALNAVALLELMKA